MSEDMEGRVKILKKISKKYKYIREVGEGYFKGTK
jgi:hypothetical protein